MITQNQWNALHEYVTERIKTEERFFLVNSFLEEKFGITRPFWEDMCVFASSQERTYTGDPHWSQDDPHEIEYKRKAADAP